MDQEGGLVRHRQNLVDRSAQGRAGVRIGGLLEADVAVGNLDKGKASLRRFGRADEARGRHAARDRPDDARPRPQHAFQGLPAVKAAVAIVNHLVSPCPAKGAVQRGDSGDGRFIPRRVQKNCTRGAQNLNSWASALIILISKYGFTDILADGRVVLDPSRVAAKIVSGIGFIGGGVIFVRKDLVRGLTKVSRFRAGAPHADSPTGIAEYERIIEGLRKAGLPEE